MLGTKLWQGPSLLQKETGLAEDNASLADRGARPKFSGKMIDSKNC